MATISTDNYTISGCEIYFSASIADADLCGNTGGLNATGGAGADFRTTTKSLGNVVSADMTPNVTYMEHFVITAAGKKTKDHEIVNQEGLTLSFVLDEINSTNFSKYLLGRDITAASLTDTCEPAFAVLQNSLAQGSAQLYVKTDVGHDYVYIIPKCSLRPNGALTLNGEAWVNIPMQLEILYTSWTPATQVLSVGQVIGSCPFGVVVAAAIT